jgi:hypothetical protein
MTEEELTAKMLAFIDTQDGDYNDEWYATRRDFAATILSDFSEYLGLELVVPAHVPQLKKPEIDRNAVLQAMLPEINKLFDIEYKKRTENT